MVKELEGFSSAEIFKRLTLPVRQTIKRIRVRLADKNRYLAEDEEFAREYQKKQKQ